MVQAFSLPMGVIVARERSSDPWQTYRWRPVSVFLDEAGQDTTGRSAWREVERGRGYVHYHAATLPLLLKGKETVAYRVNLANGVPSVYVVMRENAADGGLPVSIQQLTVSPFEIQGYAEAGVETVERVPMPEPLVRILNAFVDGSGAKPPCASNGTPAATSGAPGGPLLRAPWPLRLAGSKFVV